MTITPILSFFYFIWNSGSFWTYILSHRAVFVWQQRVCDKQLIPLSAPLCQSDRKKQENMIKLNFRRIEYLRTKPGRFPFMSKLFFRFSAVRCAELSHDDRLRCREVPMSWVVTTVFMAIKSVLIAMKTVVVRKSRQINAKWSVLPSKTKRPNLFISKSADC